MRQAAQEGDDRVYVGVVHVVEQPIRHRGIELSPLVVDAVPDGVDHLLVAPVADTGGVVSQVGGRKVALCEGWIPAQLGPSRISAIRRSGVTSTAQRDRAHEHLAALDLGFGVDVAFSATAAFTATAAARVA